jgi:hypothetical protein
VLRVAGKHASMPRRSGGRRGRPRRLTPEGSGSASPASSRDRRGAQRKGKRAGKSCSPRKEASKATKGEDGAVAVTFSDGRGLGGTPMDRGSGAGCVRCSSA